MIYMHIIQKYIDNIYILYKLVSSTCLLKSLRISQLQISWRPLRRWQLWHVGSSAAQHLQNLRGGFLEGFRYLVCRLYRWYEFLWIIQHVGSAGGVCPAWNKVDCDYAWWVSAAVCCSCSHGVDFTVFFHIKCGCSQVDFISFFSDAIDHWMFWQCPNLSFFAKSGGKINNHL